MNNEYEQSLVRLKDSLDEWAAATIYNSENKLAKGMLRCVLETSSLVDNFSTWLLAGAGATSVLLISNLESISKYVGHINYKFTLGLVCLAMVFGVLEKIAALRITIYRASEKAGFEIASAVMEDHQMFENKIEGMAKPHGISVTTKIDIDRTFSIVINAYPRILHNYLKRIFSKAVNEPMYGYNKSIKIYFWQTLFALAEAISFVLFAASVVVDA